MIIDLDLKILKDELEFRIADGGKIHLNYLVGSKCWQPTSHLRILLWCRVLIWHGNEKVIFRFAIFINPVIFSPANSEHAPCAFHIFSRKT